MTDITTIFNSFDISDLVTFVLGTGLGSALKHWWSSKTAVEKKDFVKDLIDASKDKKYTPDEIKNIIDEHF